MYISYRLSSLLRPHCPPGDTELTLFHEIRNANVFASCCQRQQPLLFGLVQYSIVTLALVITWSVGDSVVVIGTNQSIVRRRSSHNRSTQKQEARNNQEEKKKIRGKHNVRFGGFRNCVKTVNRRHIHAYYVSSMHATWLKVVYSTSSQNGEHVDMNNKEQISFFLRMESLLPHFSPV